MPDGEAIALELKERTLFVFPDGSYRKSVLKTFDLACPATTGWQDVLTALLSHPAYRDDYISPEEAPPARDAVHGPYRLDALSVDSFQLVAPALAEEQLGEWIRDGEDENPWEGPNAEVANAQHAAGQPLIWQWYDSIRHVLHAPFVLHLPLAEDPGFAGEHDYGWVLWMFVEWVAVDPGAGCVSILSLRLD